MMYIPRQPDHLLCEWTLIYWFDDVFRAVQQPVTQAQSRTSGKEPLHV